MALRIFLYENSKSKVIFRTWSSRQVDQQCHEQTGLDEETLYACSQSFHVEEGRVGNYAESPWERSLWQPNQQQEGWLLCIERVYPRFICKCNLRLLTNGGYGLHTSFFTTFARTSRAPRYVPGEEHCIRVLMVSKLFWKISWARVQGCLDCFSLNKSRYDHEWRVRLTGKSLTHDQQRPMIINATCSNHDIE